MEFFVFIGNYGSGKTELALNFALAAAQEGKKTVLVDLDIVNPYFRSAEQETLLEQHGVDLICPPYARSGVDLPVVPAEVARVFLGEYDRVVFDVGGDKVGATALGQYHKRFKQLENLNVFYVVNTKRPLCGTAEDICYLFHAIERSARLPITGFINNTNLARDTVAEDLLAAQEILRAVTKETGIPVVYTAGWQKTLDKLITLTDDIDGKLLPINTYMRPAWLDFEG